ncbi:hypothetical protein [Actinobacillus capsulatus]|uniref:hypothetical protein n=1 Tax=Actinobacillus capsulatus TaxID=717 RepID=UPI00037F5B6C|nr:hypothetical protein [Actinobacillus capsulatus]
MQAKITFYEIDRCGFYKYTGGSSQRLFGNMGDVLANLMQWTTNASLEETKVHDSIDEIIGTYVSSIVTEQAHGSYLLVLWNEVFSSDANKPVKSSYWSI